MEKRAIKNGNFGQAERSGMSMLPRRSAYAGLDLGEAMVDKSSTYVKAFSFLYRAALAAMLLGGLAIAFSYFGSGVETGLSVPAMRSSGVYLAGVGGLIVLIIYAFIPDKYIK